jgi:hypothetical protein
MKAIQWQSCLIEQRERYGKTIFTLPELCSLAGGAPLASMRVQAHRLLQVGVLQRCAVGRYCLPGAADLGALLPLLDRSAYATGLYALHRHNLVTQSPSEIVCFTNRRHNRSRLRDTSVGRLRFVRISPTIYSPPTGSILAPPGQALCDWILDLRQQGATAIGQAALRPLPPELRAAAHNCAKRYPQTVRQELEELINHEV